MTTLVSSVTDSVVKALRAMIVSGEIAPGDRIPTKDLQERFSISHIPIREALRRLEAEQLVVNIPRRSAIAAPVSRHQVFEIYDVRRMIEPEIAYRAVQTMTEDHVADVQRRLIALDKLTERSDFGNKFIAADRAFHWAILEPAVSAVAAPILDQLWQMSQRYIRIAISQMTTVDRTHEQHHEIWDAMTARDAPKVRDALRAHLSLTQTVLADRLPADHDEPPPRKARA